MFRNIRPGVMAQVSRRKVNSKVQSRIDSLFHTLLSNMAKKDSAIITEGLLTSTEKIMLSKRLAVQFMLLKGYDYLEIIDTVKVSKQTIWNVKNSIKHMDSNYRKVLEQLMRKEGVAQTLSEINYFIEKSLPPRVGSNWRKERAKLHQRKRDSAKPF